MSQPKILTDILGRQLKPAGFKRTADTWHLRNDDTILVLNLQKSPYGRQYYINIAAWLNALGAADVPKAHTCHIRCRWEDLVPNANEKHLEKLLDLENTSTRIIHEPEGASTTSCGFFQNEMPFPRRMCGSTFG
jgi:hypothetical protein